MKIEDFDFSVDLLQALLWQYNNSGRLKTLLTEKNLWYGANQAKFWEDWVRDVFDLRTANDFGLDVWAIILNIWLGPTDNPFIDFDGIFGFGPNNQNFGNGNFSSVTSGLFELTTEQRRLVLRLRYFQLISRGTLPEAHAFLNELFKDTGAYVYIVDNLDMSIKVHVFDTDPDLNIEYILDHFDVFPRPAGVGISYQIYTKIPFGFGPENENFENGNFVITRD